MTSSGPGCPPLLVHCKPSSVPANDSCCVLSSVLHRSFCKRSTAGVLPLADVVLSAMQFATFRQLSHHMVEAAMQSSAYCGLSTDQLAGLRQAICTALPICTTATAVLMMPCTAATYLIANTAVALCCFHLVQVVHAMQGSKGLPFFTIACCRGF